LYMVPQRAGDPLGLGAAGIFDASGSRPPAPSDPDAYDRQREDKEYARSLLDEAERQQLDKDIADEGYMSIEHVRSLVANHSSKNSVETGGLDPEMLTLIDARVNYKIFIAGDWLYLREELYEHYPFHEFNVQPEAIFVQQEIGVFPARKYAMSDDLEYVARDAGDESVEFTTIEDLVGKATRPGYEMQRAPLRIVKTKIYVGKERWDDFQLLQRFCRGATRVAAAQIAYSNFPKGEVQQAPTGTAYSGILSMFGRQKTDVLLLTQEGELKRREEEAKRREEEAQRREEEAKRREEEAKRREEEARRREEEVAATQKRLDADLKRIEQMLAGIGGVTGNKPKNAAAKTTDESAAQEQEDSVAL